MEIQVKFFGVLRDCAGAQNQKIRVPAGSTALETYRFVLGTFAEKRPLPKILFAVNQEFVKASRTLRDGDELALIPPMSGG